MASLNPQAPEFFPTQLHKLHQLQPPPCTHFPNSIYAPHHRYYYYYHTLSSFHNHHPLYFPTITLPPPFRDSTKPEPEPTHFHSIKDDPTSHASVHPERVQKGDVVTEAKTVGGSKGFVQKQVFKALLSCGTLKGRRGSDGLRHKSYKVQRMRGEETGQRKKVDYLRNQHVTRFQHEQCFRSLPKNKRCYYPLLPVNVDGGDTTVMIRNIPSKYTREMVVEFLDNHCMQLNLRENEAGKEKDEESSTLAFDFVYVPIDFKSGLNKGYAFVNFTKPQAAWKFLLTASNMKWSLFQSHKIREVVSARLQGKQKLEKHFETMNFPCDSEDVLPVCFSPPRDGVTKGEQRTVGKLMMKRKQV